jgi:hypothetical protein
MTQETTLTESELAQFTGTEYWYRHPFKRSITYTDGVKYVAEKAGAYWLIDEIVFAQMEKHIAAEEFQLWKLQVNSDTTARLTCEDGNGNMVMAKRIGFTDFPLDEISFYFTNNVLLLPSEY